MEISSDGKLAFGMPLFTLKHEQQKSNFNVWKIAQHNDFKLLSKQQN